MEDSDYGLNNIILILLSLIFLLLNIFNITVIMIIIITLTIEQISGLGLKLRAHYQRMISCVLVLTSVIYFLL